MKKVHQLAITGLILVFLMLIFNGCTRRLVDFTVISSKNVTMRLDAEGKGDRVIGKDEVYWLITIPLGVPNLKEAIDKAIESAGPDYDALIDGVVSSYGYWYILSGVSGYKVEGTPIKTQKLMTELNSGDGEVDLAGQNVLYHSSLGISNEQAISNLRTVNLTDEDKQAIARGM